jgi:hypothetical protein
MNEAMLNRLISKLRRAWAFPFHVVILYACVLALGLRYWHIVGRSRVLIRQLESQENKHKVEVMQLDSHVYNLLYRLTDLKSECDPDDKRHQEAKILGEHLYKLFGLDLSIVSARHPREARVLGRILELRQQGVRWYPLGQSPEEGFNSTGFAAFVLRELKLSGRAIQEEENLFGTISRIWTRFPRVSQPGFGDLVFYADGYVLFQFEDQYRRPFVIGMTPFGILGLDPHFARVIGCRRMRL